MESLACAITDFLLRRDVIQKEDYEIYVYGYAVFLEQLFQVIGFIILGVITGHFLHTCVFLGTFYLLRSSFGGYHAETSFRCMMLSYGGWAVVMSLTSWVNSCEEVPIVLWALLVLDAGVFAKLGPVAHANKPLTQQQKKRNKIKGFLILAVCSLAAFLGRTCVDVGTVYIGAVTFVSVLAILGKRKEGTKYEED